MKNRMITVTPPRRETTRNRVRRNVLLNGRQIGYIAKPDKPEEWEFEPVAVRHHYVWIASAGGELSMYHTEVGAVARVVALRSISIAEAALEEE